MALTKKTFIDNQTVIMASDMNKIQDEIIANGNSIGTINSNLNDYTTFQVTAPNGGTVYSQACWYNKATKIVHIHAMITGGNWTGNAANPIQIPSAYRTSSGLARGIGYVALSTGYAMCPVIANANGYINQSISGGWNFTQICVEMTYHI